MTFRDALRRSDPLLAGSAVLLMVVSLVLLVTGPDGTVRSPFFLRQSIAVALAIMLLVGVSRVHYSLVRTIAPAAYVVLLGLLLLVLQAAVIRGAASWLRVGILTIQPSELAKVVLVVVLAKILSERRDGRLDLRTLLKTTVFMGLPVGLILLQPDLGTAALLLFLWGGLILVSGIRRWQVIVLLVLLAIGSSMGWQYGLREYQRERIRVFVQPRADPLGAGYTVLQSMTAFGSGGVFGRGLGYGPQSRLKFLPEHRTDFIFARLGEELGLVGVTGVLALYGVILSRMHRAARHTSDPFGQALAIGAFLALLVGVFVNAGMNIGLLPVTGVPLPFVSYGGSNLIAMTLLVALVESVLIHGETWETGEDDDAVAVKMA